MYQFDLYLSRSNAIAISVVLNIRVAVAGEILPLKLILYMRDRVVLGLVVIL